LVLELGSLELFFRSNEGRRKALVVLENVALNKLRLLGSFSELVLELAGRLLVDGGLAGVVWAGRCGTMRQGNARLKMAYTLE